MKSIKTYGVLTLIVVVLIAIFQNAGAVTIRFLLWDISMSKALLLPLVLAIGFLIGYLLSGIRHRM